ncbi:type VI secretion system amidase effector protein Tae4 [Enterobacteriaceae bacterium H20N1]|uniref:Type VI secretion system amidase effector protein Tae4 n=1 Tax=Dryocola boscaweniae TaxID=2925397 RepID=A0A9X2W5X8_9ENTR|nr:type VI secretion system amidase effector protein Tae4 [Dryocola boscaweniae]MCT4700603.1 type VI secretion system amidase effector protein Tae4 [Dryocola boscaweniae]MCT4717793.1 type VI secretion system amidase effector protein Tae4 [Dryocola boscaweniae]
MTIRPSFISMWQHFSTVNQNVPAVGKIIGGKVEENINSHIFENACAIRMSYALSYSGINIPRSNRWSTSSGKDKKWYIYRVSDMIKFLTFRFGNADITSNFSDAKGILLFNVTGWSDATGHLTLWDGNSCSDKCYFPQSSGVQLWTLK